MPARATRQHNAILDKNSTKHLTKNICQVPILLLTSMGL
jgi:hypothetical protein